MKFFFGSGRGGSFPQGRALTEQKTCGNSNPTLHGPGQPPEQGPAERSGVDSKKEAGPREPNLFA